MFDEFSFKYFYFIFFTYLENYFIIFYYNLNIFYLKVALNGFNIEINSEASNPGTLNSWLRANNGYVSGSDLDETTIPNINPNKV